MAASNRDDGFTIWFTGMSGAGKSTLANYVGARLAAAGKRVEILDGDEAGNLLGYELGETKEERELGTRRIGWVASLLSRNGVIAISATVSPHRELREELRREIGRFVEVFTDCPVDVLIQRDVKGLYKKALAGELPHFIGITEPYEPPALPEVTVDSNGESVHDAAERIIETLRSLGYLTAEQAKIALFGKTKGATAARRRAATKAATAARRTALTASVEAGRKALGVKPEPESKPGRDRRTADTETPAKAVPAPARAEPKAKAATATAKSKATVTAPKKAAAKKATPKKATPKKAAAKKAAPKKAAKKATAKKATPKKAAAKQRTRKPAAKKKAAAKKAKKAGARRTTASKARKPAAKKKPPSRSARRTRTVSRPTRRAAKVAKKPRRR